MSDLSWLNPTPHAIAVYASQPLSPVATQHSLPSGRYSLLGPVFHRLDRTSFAWRTHSITSSARARSLSEFETERLGGLEIDHELELCRQHNRQLTRLLAFEDASGINAGLTICISNAGRVTHQAARRDIIAQDIDRGNSMSGRQRELNSDMRRTAYSITPSASASIWAEFQDRAPWRS